MAEWSSTMNVPVDDLSGVHCDRLLPARKHSLPSRPSAMYSDLLSKMMYILDALGLVSMFHLTMLAHLSMPLSQDCHAIETMAQLYALSWTVPVMTLFHQSCHSLIQRRHRFAVTSLFSHSEKHTKNRKKLHEILSMTRNDFLTSIHSHIYYIFTRISIAIYS